MNPFIQAKSSLSIERVVEYYGIKLTKNKSRCPFHKEKTDSFSINRSKQIFKCFGCGVAGDIITFTSKLFNLRNIDAVKKLSEDFNLGLFDENISRKQRIKAKRIEIKINKEKVKLENAKKEHSNAAENYALFDRFCIDLKPEYPNIPSDEWLIYNELRIEWWEKLKEGEVKLWKLRNLQK